MGAEESVLTARPLLAVGQGAQRGDGPPSPACPGQGPLHSGRSSVAQPPRPLSPGRRSCALRGPGRRHSRPLPPGHCCLFLRCPPIQVPAKSPSPRASPSPPGQAALPLQPRPHPGTRGGSPVSSPDSTPHPDPGSAALCPLCPRDACLAGSGSLPSAAVPRGLLCPPPPGGLGHAEVRARAPKAAKHAQQRRAPWEPELQQVSAEGGLGPGGAAVRPQARPQATRDNAAVSAAREALSRGKSRGVTTWGQGRALWGHTAGQSGRAWGTSPEARDELA